MSSVKAQALAMTLKASGSQTVATHPMMVRVPYSTLAAIDVIKQRSGKSRTEVACQLLAIGIDEVLDAMDPEDKFLFCEEKDSLIGHFHAEDILIGDEDPHAPDWVKDQNDRMPIARKG